MKQKRYTSIGIAIGAIAGCTLAVALWLYNSYVHGCLLEPIQAINAAGPDCYFKNYLSEYSAMYFGLPTLASAIIGSLIGFIVGFVRRIKR